MPILGDFSRGELYSPVSGFFISYLFILFVPVPRHNGTFVISLFMFHGPSVPRRARAAGSAVTGFCVLLVPVSLAKDPLQPLWCQGEI